MTNLSPWMVESAYRYLKAAKHLRRGHDMLDIAQINAAIGMEILLKSFVARPNGTHGKIHETYDLEASMIKAAHLELKRSGRAAPKLDKHDLLRLFYAVPANVRSRLLFDQEE